MNLTLRTLLAWLDDTPSPAASATIGPQVEGAPAALDLLGKIFKLIHATPAEASLPDESTDPNDVAAYLDNELSPDDVLVFEGRCLSSDPLIAEVSEVHQILSDYEGPTPLDPH